MCTACGKTGDVRKLCNLMEPCDSSRRGFPRRHFKMGLEIEDIVPLLDFIYRKFSFTTPHPPPPSTLLYLDG